MTETSPAQVDVDDLAREKVQEIERLLDSSNGFKLGDLTSWLSILQQIITAADLHRTNDKNDNLTNFKCKIETDESIYADYADDGEQFNAIDLSEQFASNSVKWTIRVQAFKLVHRLVILSKTPLLKHLPDLVRLSFVAATSPYDDLKLQGFEMFKFLINRFASVEEKEFPGHSILEQYRTQVLSALKPAFNLDAPPYITAIASHVCCLWICRGLEKDPNNLSRTYQMMMATIEKLENQNINHNSKLYTESELEQERLDILSSWAELYIAAKESDVILSVELSKLSSPSKVDSKQLNELVKPQVESFIDKWWEALKDYALLIIPAPRLIGSSSHDNENVYTRQVALRLFAPVWPRLILASSIWLCLDEAKSSNESDDNPSIPNEVPGDSKDLVNICDSSNKTSKTKYFKFICGMLMKELCRCYSDDASQHDSLPEATLFAIRSLFFIVNNVEMKLALVEDLAVAQELYNILYGILIKRTRSKSSQQLVLKCLLDQIFNLVAAKIVEKPEYAKYSLANLLESININLKKLDDSSAGDKQEYETIKVNLYIKIHSIIAIIKSTPKSCLDRIDLFNALIDSFQAILNSKADPSLGTGLVSVLKELYNILPRELAIDFMSAMVSSQTQVVSNLLSSIQIEDSKEHNKKSQSLSIAEIHIKSITLALDSADVDVRSKLITAHLKSSLSALPKPLSFDNLKDFSLQRRYTLNIGLKYIEDMRLKYPDDFNASLEPNMKEVYETAIKLQQDIKAEDESKHNAQTVKKPLVNNVGLKKPPPAKIVLKADFSNFYAKKS